MITQQIDRLSQCLVGRAEEWVETLKGWKEELEVGPSRHLAKGELHGSSAPLWRGCSTILKGVGFNYDFSDEEGEGLELHTGRPHSDLRGRSNVSLIEVGDLLVTTGMDGIFPADLPVAFVKEVSPLSEGAIFYEILATPTAPSLIDLSVVTVLPRVMRAE